MKTIVLNNGIEMPMLGIGTFNLSPDQAERSVLAALKDGYRLMSVIFLRTLPQKTLS